MKVMDLDLMMLSSVLGIFLRLFLSRFSGLDKTTPIILGIWEGVALYQQIATEDYRAYTSFTPYLPTLLSISIDFLLLENASRSMLILMWTVLSAVASSALSSDHWYDTTRTTSRRRSSAVCSRDKHSERLRKAENRRGDGERVARSKGRSHVQSPPRGHVPERSPSPPPLPRESSNQRLTNVFGQIMALRSRRTILTGSTPVPLRSTEDAPSASRSIHLFSDPSGVSGWPQWPNSLGRGQTFATRSVLDVSDTGSLTLPLARSGPRAQHSFDNDDTNFHGTLSLTLGDDNNEEHDEQHDSYDSDPGQGVAEVHLDESDDQERGWIAITATPDYDPTIVDRLSTIPEESAEYASTRSPASVVAAALDAAAALEVGRPGAPEPRSMSSSSRTAVSGGERGAMDLLEDEEEDVMYEDDERTERDIDYDPLTTPMGSHAGLIDDDEDLLRTPVARSRRVYGERGEQPPSPIEIMP